MQKIYCQIQGVYEGFRDLESFNSAVSRYWSARGEFFPMYDVDTSEIFECAFNAQEGFIVAYREVSVEEFRKRLEKAGNELIQARVRIAIDEASEEVARLYAACEFASKVWAIRHM